jgi:hypothetical protein
MVPVHWAAVAAGRASHGLFHDALDRPDATAALGAAAEAAIDLARGAWRCRRDQGGADVLVAQHVAGTDDHGNEGREFAVEFKMYAPFNASFDQDQKKNAFLSASKLLDDRRCPQPGLPSA